MVRCPVCDSTTVIVELRAEPRATCLVCDATWLEENGEQSEIRRPVTPVPDPNPWIRLASSQ